MIKLFVIYYSRDFRYIIELGYNSAVKCWYEFFISWHILLTLECMCVGYLERFVYSMSCKWSADGLWMFLSIYRHCYKKFFYCF